MILTLYPQAVLILKNMDDYLALDNVIAVGSTNF